MLFAAGITSRVTPIAGEKWYQIKIGDRVIDTRPFNPLAAYMLLGEVINQMATPEETHVPITAKDYADALIGIRRLAGTGLFVFESIVLDSPKAFEDSLKNFAREFIGGFATPFRAIRDVATAPFSQDEAVFRETREGNIFLKAVGSVPFLAQQLPARPSPTRAGAIGADEKLLGVEAGLIRQLTGISLRKETGVEEEIARLDVQAGPRTGDVTLNRLITEKTGAEVDKRIGTLLRSSSYKRLDDADKRVRLRKELSKIRTRAKRTVLRTERPRIIKDLVAELAGLTLSQAKTELRKRRTAGAIDAIIFNRVLRELQRNR
jgi:hypothetical protein